MDCRLQRCSDYEWEHSPSCNIMGIKSINIPTYISGKKIKYQLIISSQPWYHGSCIPGRHIARSLAKEYTSIRSDLNLWVLSDNEIVPVHHSIGVKITITKEASTLNASFVKIYYAYRRIWSHA